MSSDQGPKKKQGAIKSLGALPGRSGAAELKKEPKKPDPAEEEVEVEEEVEKPKKEKPKPKVEKSEKVSKSVGDAPKPKKQPTKASKPEPGRGEVKKAPKKRDHSSEEEEEENEEKEKKDGKKSAEKFPVCKSFDDMHLKDELLRGIYAYGFESPSAIQQRAVLPIVGGNDTIAQAQSGTGKTAAFGVSVLQRLDLSNRMCQALVLAPTRELAQQIRKVFQSLGDFMKISSHACVGGTLVRDDVATLSRGVQIVVGLLVVWVI